MTALVEQHGNRADRGPLLPSPQMGLSGRISRRNTPPSSRRALSLVPVVDLFVDRDTEVSRLLCAVLPDKLLVWWAFPTYRCVFLLLGHGEQQPSAEGLGAYGRGEADPSDLWIIELTYDSQPVTWRFR